VGSAFAMGDFEFEPGHPVSRPWNGIVRGAWRLLSSACLELRSVTGGKTRVQVARAPW